MTDTRGYIHQNKTNSTRMLGDVDIGELTARVAALTDHDWDVHNANKPNRFGVFGTTQHVVMKFVRQLSCPVVYDELPTWDDWHDLVKPVLDRVRDLFGYEQAEFPRVMLARVPAGGEISIHADGGKFPSFCHKIHVPLITNPKVSFFIEPDWHHLPVGHAIEVNNNARHMVRNSGSVDRVHLVFELFRSPLDLSEHQLLTPHTDALPHRELAT
jgi:hypothetical protein